MNLAAAIAWPSGDILRSELLVEPALKRRNLFGGVLRNALALIEEWVRCCRCVAVLVAWPGWFLLATRLARVNERRSHIGMFPHFE